MLCAGDDDDDDDDEEDSLRDSGSVCVGRSSFMQGLVNNQFTKLRRLKVSSVKNTPSSPEIKAGACDNH